MENQKKIKIMARASRFQIWDLTVKDQDQHLVVGECKCKACQMLWLVGGWLCIGLSYRSYSFQPRTTYHVPHSTYHIPRTTYHIPRYCIQPRTSHGLQPGIISIANCTSFNEQEYDFDESEINVFDKLPQSKPYLHHSIRLVYVYQVKLLQLTFENSAYYLC